MSVLNKIAYYQQRRDEVPNQELAHELALAKDTEGIQEIAENLWHKNKSVRSDCLKVLYEIGYIEPGFIAGYVEEFLKLLHDKENRMVWGAMIGLSTIADQRPEEIWKNIDDVISATEQGTLITYVWGIKTIAHIAKADPEYGQRLFPILLEHLKKCNSRDLPLHAESARLAVNENNQADYLAVVRARQSELTSSQSARLKKILKDLQD